MKTCINCNSELTGRQRKYCSQKCKNIWQGKQRDRKVYHYICKGCGRESTTKAHSAQNYCSHECYINNREVCCKWCGEEFKATGPRHEYCSDECQDKYGAKCKLDIKKCRGCFNVFVSRYGRVVCSSKCREKYNRMNTKLHALREHYRQQRNNPEICTYCGDSFIRRYGDKSKCCSNQCRTKLRRQTENKARYRRRLRKRSRNGIILDINKIKVFERDDWNCQACGKRTPKKLIGNINKDAPEMDHIIPLAKGGTHTYNNVQLLCRNCNGKKSDNLQGQRPMLFESPMPMSDSRAL